MSLLSCDILSTILPYVYEFMPTAHTSLRKLAAYNPPPLLGGKVVTLYTRTTTASSWRDPIYYQSRLCVFWLIHVKIEFSYDSVEKSFSYFLPASVLFPTILLTVVSIFYWKNILEFAWHRHWKIINFQKKKKNIGILYRTAISPTSTMKI